MVGVRSGFSFVLNGRVTQVHGQPPQTTLLDFVRSEGLTGAKEGCAEGECGACAVILVGQSRGRTVYRAVNSCLIPLPAVADGEVLTVEALAAEGRLREVQSAMIREGGSQCGYCTPGFVVSMFAAHHAGERDAHALGGNLCRCTGYRPIQDALASLGPVPADAFAARLLRPAPVPAALGYAVPEGRFSRPETLAEVFEILRSDHAAKVVAGNTDLGVLTNLRDHRYAHLVSLEGIPELREFEAGSGAGDGALTIGAGLTLTAIAESWPDAPPVFREWLALFASPLIRNRATLGGNLATASPIGDSAPLLLALDAEVVIAGAGGTRALPLSAFFRGYRQTELAAGEILRAVRIPKPLPPQARFFKVAKRSMDDISTVAAGLAIVRGNDGVVSKARFAFGGVAATPLRALEAEACIEGTHFAEADLARATAQLRRTLTPLSDHRGSAAYRLAMAQSLLEKFWSETR